jgi:hypothetical protein
MPLFEKRSFKLRRLARIERAFQPAEYNTFSQGLFSYLDGRAQRGLAQYRRNGAWCYLGVNFSEANMFIAACAEIQRMKC